MTGEQEAPQAALPRIQLRPAQQAVVDYRGGPMGVSAVPGSGKTFTLARLAGETITSKSLGDDQEVLVVTLVNSAVENFTSRINAMVERRGLLPHFGYRVRTLHGLAHDIVRERPELVGLSNRFDIIDEREAERIRRDAVDTWLGQHPTAGDEFINMDLEPRRLEEVRRRQWPDTVSRIANEFIRMAKDLQLTPPELNDRLRRALVPLSLAEMGAAIYTDYQRALTYRGAVDFDELIRLALRALELDADLLTKLRHRWPIILEDEAQDSSHLQERILRKLAGPGGNWVRVGDPNQAVYETFTTASPVFLRRFLDEPGVESRELPNSGRSSPSIISLANALIDWTRTAHPEPAVRDALTLPHIEPTPPGDPQPNPTDTRDRIHLSRRSLSPAAELRAVADSLARWLPENPDRTAAVLVPRNARGFELIDELKARDLPYVELLRSTQSTRETAGALTHMLRYLADPSLPTLLAQAYRVWRRDDREEEQQARWMRRVARALRRCDQVEDFVWPRPGQDWLQSEALAQGFEDNLGPLREQLERFRELVRRWQEAALLPIDQLVLTLAQDLFHEPADLAMAHKLAVLLGRVSASHPDWHLPELAGELEVIARNERRFLGLSADDTGFTPDAHKGEVAVATIHKAKGLEWDRVYIMAANNYSFPSGQPQDSYISEPYFIRDRLNLSAEALAQLRALRGGDEGDADAVYELQEGQATRDARMEYIAERLRLLYVGITRARTELIITWNTGRRGDSQPAVPLIALMEFWEAAHGDGLSEEEAG